MLKIILAITCLLSVFESKNLIRNKKSKRPYGLLTPEEERSHCRSITAPIYEFCRRMIDCNMCLETDHCGKFIFFFNIIYYLLSYDYFIILNLFKEIFLKIFI